VKKKNGLSSQETHFEFVSGRSVAYALLTLERGKVAGRYCRGHSPSMSL